MALRDRFCATLLTCPMQWGQALTVAYLRGVKPVSLPLKAQEMAVSRCIPLFAMRRGGLLYLHLALETPPVLL